MTELSNDLRPGRRITRKTVLMVLAVGAVLGLAWALVDQPSARDQAREQFRDVVEEYYVILVSDYPDADPGELASWTINGEDYLCVSNFDPGAPVLRCEGLALHPWPPSTDR